MADKLIFPIGFDLEAAVKSAEKEGDKALKNLQQLFSRQPLVLKTDTRGFAELMQDTDSLKARLKEVAAQFNSMPTAVKFNLDSEGRVKQLSADGKALWDELMRINTALQGVSMSATQLLRQNQREMEAEQKAEQKRQQTIAASLRAEYKRIEAKKQAEAASRRELEMLNRQYAAEERRQRLAASEASIAKRQKVISTLRAEENTIVNITAKLQHWQKVMNSSDMNGKQFKRATEEVQRLSQKLSEAQERIDKLTGKTKAAATATTTAAAKQSAAVRQVTNEFKNQDGYISRLIKRLAVYAGYRQITGFLDNVRKVTAEFELQRVSLGAIIQDQQRANALFSEIKSFALKSPVSILDLTKYTKQLAAYKIGVDELFETTKKLTDVSVGLGVSMDRVVLAYGQTRATGYLRASEIRQFTEMGVPIVEELAAKLSKMNGELVTAAQVMDMVSKRAISFELVKEVFDDMTSAGGMFYNMQEKQGNTLYGLWVKLGDAASVMYDQIGNTKSVDSAMKGTIQLLTDLMKNWREVGRTMGAAAVGFAALWSVKKAKGWQSNIDAAKIAANEKYIASSNAYRAAIQAEQAARATATAEEYRAIAAKTASAEASYTAARAEYLAARNTTLWSKAWNKLKAAFLGNWLTLLIAGLAAIGMHIYNNIEKANRLSKALKEIKDEGSIEADKSVYNFETLAKTAVEAADGSREQKEALEELQRTYRNIIPAQDLTIEKLREMKGEYTSLTNAIRQYIAQQTQQKQIDTIISETESKVIDAQRRLKKFLSKQTIEYNYEDVALGFSEQQIDKAIKGMKEVAKTTKDSFQIIKRAFKVYAGIELSDNQVHAIQFYNDSLLAGHVVIKDFVSALTEQETRINAVIEDMSGATAEMGIFADRWAKTTERINNTPLTAAEGTFLYDRQKANASIKEYIAALKDDFATVGIAWKEEWANVVEEISSETAQLSVIDFDAISAAVREKGGDYAITLGNVVRTAQNAYNNLIPQNAVVQSVRSKFEELANSMGLIDKVRGNMMGATEGLEDYRKKINDLAKDYATQVENLTKILAVVPTFSKNFKEINEQLLNAQNLKDFYSAMADILGRTTSGAGRSTQSDPRLNNLKEEISLVQKLYQEYKQLEKQEGASKAAADMEKMAGASIKALSDKYDISLPTTAKDLTSALEILYNKMAQLPKKVFPTLEKDLHELRWTIEKVNIDDAQQKIEAELKKLSDKISRTKTAREFYDRILSQTGDAEMAATLTMNVYGEGGEDLFNNTVSLLQEYFGGVEVDLPINFKTQQIDYKALRKIWEADKALPKDMRKIPEAYDSAIKQMLDSADSANQKMIEGWLKATEKAKTYSDKLADVYRTTATEIERINKAMAIGDIDAGIGTNLIAEYERKQADEVAKLEYEAFKNMPLYVQMFDDLDNASTSTLTNMRDRLIAMQGEWKNLNPTQLKEMQSRLNEINAQLAKRNPFKTLAASIKEYRDLQRDHGSEKKLNKEIEVATDAYLEAKAALKKQLEENPDDKEAVENLQQRVDLSEKELQQLQKIADAYKRVKDAIKLSVDELMQMLNWAGDIAKAVANISEALGADEEDVQYWNTVADSLSQVAASIQDIVSAAMSGNVVGIISSVITAIPKMFVGFANLFNAGKIRNANKEIKKQEKLLEQLEYTYSRLEKAAEKVFGTEYISNYNQQLRNLQAQVEAYQKQMEAEKSKGKKADEDKIKEYEKSWRDTLDTIADMQGTLAERFLGTDLTSAARDFAKAWLDAYKEFGNTADKMSEKFREMIENMVVESLLARAMQRALEPTFKMIDNMREGDFYNPEFWKKAMASANKGAEAADAGAKVIMQWAKESFGYDPRGAASNLTGIKRDIASASEAEITGLAATMNTWSYYVSFVPGISTDVAAIRQVLENGVSAPIAASASGEWTDWQQQAMENYIAIQRNTADTVVECRRAAKAAEDAVSQLKRVITNNPSNTAYGVKVFT